MNSLSLPSDFRNFQRNQRTNIFQTLLILELLISLLGLQPGAAVKAAPDLPIEVKSIGTEAPVTPNLPSFNWVAYNDTFIGTGEPNTNITNVPLSSNAYGQGLRKYSDGTTIPGITFEVTVSNILVDSVSGGEANTGTDAFSTFHGIVELIGNVRFNSSQGSVTLTFSGLDPTKTYTFATTANFHDTLQDDQRITKFLLSDIDSATNLSSNGTNIVTNTLPFDTTTFSTASNTTNGYIARWVSIKPGGDGDFTLVARNFISTTRSYGPSVFMLAEEAATTCKTVDMVAVEDTYLSANSALWNYGNSPTLEISNGIDNIRRTSLLKWDLSSIPSDVTVSSARISVYITNTSNIAYGLYSLNRPWLEGTNNGMEGTGASWTFAGAGTDPWYGEGASNTTYDRFDTNLWNATSTSFTTVSKGVVIGLNSNGVTAINEWVRGITINNGLIIQTYGGTANNLIISSSEAIILANRPMLSVAYCEPTGVNLNYFRAAKTNDGVLLIWETVNEATLVGFNLFRREMDGKFEKINAELILSEKGGQLEGYVYNYLDDEAALESHYEYRLDAIKNNLEVDYSNLAPYWAYSLQLPLIQR